VNFVLVDGVGFDGQACFFGHGCGRFTFTTVIYGGKISIIR
jgi:hypothetical protein